MSTEELRVDLSDGGEYTKEQFVELYGDTVVWDQSHNYVDTLQILKEKAELKDSEVEEKVKDAVEKTTAELRKILQEKEMIAKKKDEDIDGMKNKYQDVLNQNESLKDELQRAREQAAKPKGEESNANENVIQARKTSIEHFRNTLIEINRALNQDLDLTQTTNFTNAETEKVDLEELSKIANAVNQTVQTLNATEEKLEHEESEKRKSNEMLQKIQKTFDSEKKNWQNAKEKLEASFKSLEKKHKEEVAELTESMEKKFAKEQLQLKNSLSSQQAAAKKEAEVMRAKIKSMENASTKSPLDQVESLKGQLTKMEKEMAEMKENAVEKDEKLKSFREEVKNLKSNSTSNNGDKSGTEAVIAKLTEEIESKKNALKAEKELSNAKLTKLSKMQNAKLKEANELAEKRLSNALAKQESVNQSLILQVKEAKEKYTKILNENEHLNEIVDTMKTRSRTLDAQLRGMVEEVEHQDAQLQIHIKKTEAATSAAETLSAEKEAAEKRTSELQQLITGHLSLEKEWESTIRDLRAQVAKQANELKIKDKRLTEVKSDLTGAKDKEKAGSDLDEANNNLSAQIDEMKQDLSAMEKKSKAQESTITELAKQKDETTKLSVTMKKQIEQLNLVVKEKESTCSSLLQESKDLKSEINKMKKDFQDRLEVAQEKTKTNRDSLVEENKNLRKSLQDLQLAHDFDEKETKRKVAAIRISVWASAIRDRGRNKSAVVELSYAKKEIGDLQKKLNESQNKVTTTTNELLSLKEEQKKGTEKFQSVESKLSAAQRMIVQLEKKFGTADLNTLEFKFDNLKRQSLAARKAALAAEEKTKTLFKTTGGKFAKEIESLKSGNETAQQRISVLETRLRVVSNELISAKRGKRVAENALLQATRKSQLMKGEAGGHGNKWETFLEQYPAKSSSKLSNLNARSELSNLNLRLKTMARID
eukprot:g3262.t1